MKYIYLITFILTFPYCLHEAFQELAFHYRIRHGKATWKEACARLKKGKTGQEEAGAGDGAQQA